VATVAIVVPPAVAAGGGIELHPAGPLVRAAVTPDF
jgi:hypothetical protein